ncbi:MAG TPA: ATP-binding protein [Actinophytocola sp.]|uniref:sensor histidine kinase n=1 Tax=Actinophytocola sp. TaxID=1872138 RepID=UPI002DBA47AD|nr:ATP-binding protein [Actinophytocola sp.]HEU5472393.1 ATP-binding protein [Actinophytocola sp.]
MESPWGATVGELRRLCRRYVVVLRTAVVVLAGGAAVAQAPTDRLPLVVAVVVGLFGWSGMYLRYAPRSGLLLADSVLIMALCLVQGWVVRPDALPDSTNWVFAIVTISAGGHQWFTTTAAGLLLTTGFFAAHLTGKYLAAPDDLAVSAALALWIFGAAVLARLLWVLLHVGATQADRVIAASNRAARDGAVAAARRADEREHLAVLHDTAAATLLAVGTGMVAGTEPWLAEQAGRDLEILAAPREFPDGRADLARLLGEVARQAPITVRLHVPDPMPLPAGPAEAIGAAAREALANVARHAEVDTAVVVVTRTGPTVMVDVSDQGRGFTPDQVPPNRRGVSESIKQRMSRAGGHAAVTSRPGAGTVVRLRWSSE